MGIYGEVIAWGLAIIEDCYILSYPLGDYQLSCSLQEVSGSLS